MQFDGEGLVGVPSLRAAFRSACSASLSCLITTDCLTFSPPQMSHGQVTNVAIDFVILVVGCGCVLCVKGSSIQLPFINIVLFSLRLNITVHNSKLGIKRRGKTRLGWKDKVRG
jgi:hypothetical protein